MARTDSSTIKHEPPRKLELLVHTHTADQHHQHQTTDSEHMTHVSDELVRRVLWGGEQHDAQSTGLEYVKSHALRMLARVQREDPHSAYIPLRSKSLDVRLFKVATLVAATPLEHERCDFRGVTRVPGSIDTVLGLLASEDARESYWVALNTQRGLLVNSLVSTRRLNAQTNAPFPRWNQRYAAVKFSKHTPPVECCFGEYAAFEDPAERGEDEGRSAADPRASVSTTSRSSNTNRRSRLASQDTMFAADGSPLRCAFVYRRSMDHRLFDMADVQAKLSKYGESCERLYLQDLLYQVAETSEPHVCKVVLTCSVYFTTNAQRNVDDRATKSMRHEYREFCTNSLLSLRQLLTTQWAEQMASAGVVDSPPASSTAGGLGLLGRTLSRGRMAGQPAHCGVCSAAFSLLKKRHVCHACALVVCSRCCTKQETTAGSLGGPRTASAHDLHSRRATRECILCSQFGIDSVGGGLGFGGGDARVSVSIRRHFISSTFNSTVGGASELGEDELRDSLSELDHGNNNQEDESCGVDEQDLRVVHSPEDLNLGNQQQDHKHNKQQSAGDAPPPTAEEECGGKDVDKGKGKTPPAAGVSKPRNLRVRAATEDNAIATTWREPEAERPPLRQQQQQTPTKRRMKLRCESVNIPNAREKGGPGVMLLSEIDTLSLTGSFHRVSTSSAGSGSSRRGSGGSDAGSTVSAPTAASTSSNFVRASPPLPPVRRAFRSVSEDTTLPAKRLTEHPNETNSDDEDEDELNLDDLANFNLKLL